MKNDLTIQSLLDAIAKQRERQDRPPVHYLTMTERVTCARWAVEDGMLREDAERIMCLEPGWDDGVKPGDL